MISRIRIFIGICSVYMYCFLRNYKALAEIYEEGCIGVDYHSCDLHFYRRDIAGKYLKKGGSKASDAVIEQLKIKQMKSDLANADLAEVLISIGDMNAVPILEELVSKGARQICG